MARRSFLLKVDREQDSQGYPTFDLSLLLVKSRRVHGYIEHRIAKSTPQTVVHSEEEALLRFLELRNRIAETGIPEFVGGHILGPIMDYAKSQGIPASGMTPAGDERRERESRKRGVPNLK